VRADTVDGMHRLMRTQTKPHFPYLGKKKKISSVCYGQTQMYACTDTHIYIHRGKSVSHKVSAHKKRILYREDSTRISNASWRHL